MNATIMASVDTFKSSVIRIRDILRGPGVSITGLDSMRHICLYLMSRYMTRDKVGTLGIPEDLSWETLLDTAQTKNGGVQKAIDCFYHPHLDDCLVHHFDRLFGTDKFSFDVKNPQKHKEILEILDKVNMQQVDCHMDVLGWVYEQHLGTGSTAARDLGQFFTDRFVCEYMTELCKPGFKAPGVPESVCDPSMGTGGFLTSYIKYYKKHHTDTPVDWTVQEKEIHGCDTDVKVAAVARLNMFMESGGVRHTNLLTHDSLYGDLTQTGYDVILANMPFGLKGIKHAECCDRVKNLKIRGTKSEPLFLQLMMVSLNIGGRCAVVVPDGMLVNGSSCHDETRKYLLENFEVRRIIKMKGKFFMNTGIMPSIIFFENTGKPTTTIEFWDVEKDAKGVITETMVVSVPVEKLDSSYSFDMRRYMENEKPMANPAGWPIVKLGDVCKISFGERITQKDNSGTLYPVYGSGGETFKTDNYNRNGKTCKIGRFAISSINMVMIVHGPYWLMDSGFTIESSRPEIILTEYLWYCLLMDKIHLSTLSTGSCQKNINIDSFKKVKYTCPPLPIQQEIVATLDRIYQPGTTELADTLKMTDRAMDMILANPDGTILEPIVEAQRLIRKSAQMVADVKAQMVADVKAQMVAIMKSVENRRVSFVNPAGWPMVKLGDVCKISFGERITQKDNSGTLYPVYGSGGETFKTDNYNRNGKTCKIGRFAISSINMVMIVHGPYWLMDSGFTIESSRPEIILTEYLWYCLLMDKIHLSTLSTGSCQKNINIDPFKEVKYTCPPLPIQQSILTRMDALQSQLTALENLQKQTEDNARFIMESYLGSASPNCPAVPDTV